MAVHTPTAPARFAPRPTSARSALRLNGIASIATGLVAFFAAWPLAQLFDVSDPRVLLAIGGVLVLYGLDALTFATRRGLSRRHVLPFALTEATIVLGSVLLLVLAPDALSAAGRAAVATIAAVCAWFAIAQFRGARAL